MIVCAGTGCAYRVPIIYTEAMLNSVRLVMAMATGTFEAENADEELKGLEAAAVQMEHLLAEKLATLSPSELEAYRVKGATHDNQQAHALQTNRTENLLWQPDAIRFAHFAVWFALV